MAPLAGEPMKPTVEMLRSHPDAGDFDAELLSACIEECFECASICSTCGDACLAEHDPELADCVRLTVECSEVCSTTGKVLSMMGGGDDEILISQLEACVEACHAAGQEAGRHADAHAHCGHCSRACRRCVEACEELLADLD